MGQSLSKVGLYPQALLGREESRVLGGKDFETLGSNLIGISRSREPPQGCWA